MARLLIPIVILFSLVNLVFARCNNNCNGHGNCINNNCVCTDNWAGDDCSISVRTLQSGVVITSDVDMWEWEYYKIDIRSNNNFVLEMNQLDSRNADCDIYARHGSYPTHLRWDWRDISLAASVRHEFDQPESGTWYFGVVGFLRCNYTIKVTVIGSCLEGCNGHGDCIEGACFCNNGWSGDACQFQDAALTLGQWTTSSVEKSKWAYFHARLLQPATEITWEVEQLNTGNYYDVDLYIKHESAPTIISWDYANGTTAPHTIIKIADAQPGIWYAGVMGFNCPDGSRCDFRIKASLTGATNACPDQCSMHGNCIAGICHCTSGFIGEYCETRTAPLNLNEQVSGLVGDQAWNYYTLRTNSLTPVVVSVQQQGTSGDCDLYIKSDSNPTRFDYDFFDIGLESSFNVTIPQPGSTTWFIGVFGFVRCQYTLTAIAEAPSSDCLNGGQRTFPTSPCVCPSGFSGERCEIRLIQLRQDVREHDLVVMNHWKYYNFSLNFYSTNIFIHLMETDEDSRGDVWLFASNGFSPSIRDHDWADAQINTNLHSITIQRQPLTSTLPPNYHNDIIIGVYGSPFQTKNSARYTLVAWASPF